MFCERSSQEAEVGDNEEEPPHVGSEGGSGEVTSRTGSSWRGESWAERTAYAQLKARKRPESSGREGRRGGHQGQVADDFGRDSDQMTQAPVGHGGTSGFS